MLKRDFMVMALMTSLETFFFNDAILTGDYLFAGFWGFMLFRHLKRVYLVTRLNKAVLESTKKKD